MISRREFLKASALVTIYFTIPIKLNSGDLESFSNRFFSLNKNRHIKAWLELLDNGKFLIKTGKVELGQGIKTALTQIAAEELSIDLDDIDIISGITDKTPDEMYTAGSFSIEHSGTAIKYACATLNNILLKKAEEKLSIPKDMLMIKNNFIYVKNTKEKKIPIKDLITKAPEIYQSKISRNLKTKEPHTYKLIGKPVKRLESEKIVTGDKYFIHDICPKDFTHAKIVRPSFYFKDIDEEKYKEITNKLNKNIKVIRDGLFLAVLSNSEEEAKEATEKLRVVFIRKENNYNNRNIYEFLKKTEPVKEIDVINKKSDKQFNNNKTVNSEYAKPYTAHASIGPSAALAFYDGRDLTIYTHSQGVYPLRREISLYLKLDQKRIHIYHKVGSGCYGHNGADDVALDAAIISLKVPNKWIKLIWDRSDEFIWEPYGTPMIVNLEGKLDEKGKLFSLKTLIYSDTHSTRPNSGGCLISEWHTEKGLPPVKLTPVGGAYRNAIPLYNIPNLSVKTKFIDTPLRVSAFRSLGAFANTFALESFIDECATNANIDPAQFRLNHLEDKRAIKVLKELIKFSGYHDKPKLTNRAKGIAFAQYKNHAAYVGATAYVTVKNNNLVLDNIYAVVDAGIVINPDGVKNQIEGGIIQALSIGLYEEVLFEGGSPIIENFDKYKLISFKQIPKIDIKLINNNYPSVGVGEASMGPTIAATCNAIYNATGIRIKKLPINKYFNI